LPWSVIGSLAVILGWTTTPPAFFSLFTSRMSWVLSLRIGRGATAGGGGGAGASATSTGAALDRGRVDPVGWSQPARASPKKPRAIAGASQGRLDGTLMGAILLLR